MATKKSFGVFGLLLILILTTQPVLAVQNRGSETVSNSNQQIEPIQMRQNQMEPSNSGSVSQPQEPQPPQLMLNNQGQNIQLRQEVSVTDRERMLQPDYVPANRAELQQAVEQRQQDTASNLASRSAVQRQEIIQNHFSNVALQVHDLLADDNQLDTSVGSQVRDFARNQQTAQDQLQQDMAQVASRTGFARFILGPKYSAINRIENQLEQTQQKIDELNQLATESTQTSTQSEINQLILALEDQQAMLQSELEQQTTAPSMFGWLFRLLNR